jgi:DNA-binding SARP family transcriptional activator
VSRLSLFLLGPFQATLDRELVAGFASHKVRALLAYLAVEAHRPHHRDALAGLFWPAYPDRAARDSLRNALANLRKTIRDRPAIGDHNATPPYLLITRETVQFNAASDHWLDVAAFDALAGSSQEGKPATQQLEDALALYRSPFLEGLSIRDSAEFEDWMLLVRERLQRQALVALQRLADDYEDHGAYERACEAARREVELAPWQEESHRQFMRLLALSGQRSAALAQYVACCRLLREELDVEPTAETTRLYERIRDGKVGKVAG